MTADQLDRRMNELAARGRRLVADAKTAKGQSNRRRAIRNWRDHARDAHNFLTSHRADLVANGWDGRAIDEQIEVLKGDMNA